MAVSGLKMLCMKRTLFNLGQTGLRQVTKTAPTYRIECVRHIASNSKPSLSSESKRRLFIVGIGAICGFALTPVVKKFRNKDETFPKVDAAEPIPTESRRQKMNFIADVVETCLPAVVYIEIQGRHPFTGQQMAVSNGSGFIVRQDGLILTNAHVVANKSSVKVRLHDGSIMDGIVQAVDPVSDLATIKINANDLPVLPMGESSDIRPGEWVIAMGSPLQLSNTVTCGIISTVNRASKDLGLAKDMDYIQTDAVINFGNSGGPLINLDGEAIGINTMKVTTGISFAIPSDYAKQFLEKAGKIEQRSSTRGWLGGSKQSPQPIGVGRRYMGITMLTLTQTIIQELRVRSTFPSDITHGVLIHKVVVGSPAFNGGIQPGDVITKINNMTVQSASDVYKAVESNTELHMTVRRGNDTVALNVLPEQVQ